jgi:amino acid adenylation domain-containing protein/non-ribosomal peptide synthase protein (TIGR01720 family)
MVKYPQPAFSIQNKPHGNFMSNAKKNIEAIYPLSPMQEGMLFHALYQETSDLYFEQFTCILNAADFSVDAFKQAWQQVIQHYPALRTLFVWQQGKKPLQVVLKQVELTWLEEDWRDRADPQQALDDLLAAQRRQGFDFNKAPLMRCILIRLDNTRYRLVWNNHHLLADGWSLPRILKAVFNCYIANKRGEIFALPPARPYKDYISWLQQQDLTQAETFWRHDLKGFTTPTPLIQTRYHDDTSAYEEKTFYLDASLSDALQDFARAQRITLGTVLQGAWALLLRHYSGTADVVFGTTVSGRPHDLPGVESMVGLFINTLPVRINADIKLPLSSWLQNLHARQVAREEYAYTPLAKIQQWSDLPAKTDLFQSFFVLENYPLDADMSFPGLQIEAPRNVGRTNYPLLFMVIPGQTLTLKFQYQSAFFSADTIQQYWHSFLHIIQGFVADTQQQIAHFNTLNATEIRQLAALNPVATYPVNTLHGLFEIQAAQRPDAVAVVFEQQHLSYAELNARANRVAHYLIAQGVRADSLVGICVERSLDMVIGLLGILKAGGAYVPLDPHYPAARLAFMLADSEASVLLTQQQFVADLPPHEARVFCLDSDAAILEQFSSNNPNASVPPDALAYIIYTSGSTGKPKGCQITHANATRLFSATNDWFHFNEHDVWTMFHSYAFDFSVWEIWGALLHGGKLVVIPYFVSRSPEAFYDVLIQQQVTVLNQTPSAFKQLIQVDTQAQRLSLRHVIFGGEALDFRVLKPWYAKHPSDKPRLVNMYGITETTVHVTYYPLSAEHAEYRSSVIGVPIPDLQVWVLDKHLRPLAPGVAGELCIAGAGLGRGYLQRPELTAEKFTTRDIFGTPTRLYRSGDLGRWLADGQLEYLGRIDHQVQLRGFRVELGEIETALMSHEQVQDAAVVVFDAETNPRLVAYVALSQTEASRSALRQAQGAGSLTSTLRAWLAERLPDYMIPSNFTVLDSLPLTPSGKLDRQALPDPAHSASSQQYEAPSNALEQTLVTIWNAVLKRTDIGVRDNYFELGGDSILSIQIVARARAAGLGLSPRDVFEHQCIAELALAAQPIAQIEAEQGLVAGDVPLTPIQQRFFSHLPANPHHYNQALLLELAQPLDFAALRQAFAHLIKQHDALRLRFSQEADGSWRQWHDDSSASAAQDEAGNLPLHHAVLTTEDDLNAALRGWQSSLNISAGPLQRLILIERDKQQYLFWCIHHLLVDGVSWRILLEDLQTLLAWQQTDAPQLAPKTSAYQAWSKHLRKWSSECQQHLAFWQIQPTPLTLDKPGGSRKIADAGQYTLAFDADTTQQLLTQAPSAYNTGINDLLLSALLLSLRDWTGQTRHLIDLESHGRADIAPSIDTTRTVGWFTSLFSVALSLPDTADSGATLKHIKEQLRRVPAEGISYGALRYLHKHDLPQGQILFNYLGQFDAAETPLLRLSEHPVDDFISADNNLDYPLQINGMVSRGRLQLSWTHSAELQPDTIRQLADNFAAHLRALLAHCAEHRGYTPSDFPLAMIEQHQLDNLARRYDNQIAALYPLSPMQQGMLFHALYAPNSGVYVEQIHCRLQGDVDVAALQRAWQFVVQRHPILRTAFSAEHQLQVVLHHADLPWENLDWRDKSAEQRAAALRQLLRDERRRGFALNQAPLMRIQLIREDDSTHRMIWHHHHILIDGWCLPILFSDLLAAYQNPAVLLPPVRPYQDYIAWLQQQDKAAAQTYWQTYLQGFDSPTELPILQPDSGRPDYHVTVLDLDIAPLENFARHHRLTLSTLVQGAWAIVLQRYSGNNDVVFGVTNSGRHAPVIGIAQMLGLFINTLPLRVTSSSANLLDWLEDLQQRQQQNNHYAYSALVDIQQWSDIAQGANLFDTLLVFENYPMAALQQADVLFTDMQAEEQTHYPLTLMVTPGETLQLKLSYDASRVAGGEALLHHVARVLRNIPAYTEHPAYAVPVLSEAEQTQLAAWNNTARHYTKQTVLDVFMRQVERTPQAIAIQFGAQRLTYFELQQHAVNLAFQLRDQGIDKGDLVGICASRSSTMLISVLAILQVGAAYVPLDPDYPTNRLSAIIEDSELRFILVQAALTGRLPTTTAKCLNLDSLVKKTGAASKTQFNYTDLLAAHNRDMAAAPSHTPTGKANKNWHNLERKPEPDNLLYVLFTSGSTGRPKGVAMPHRALHNLICWHLDDADLRTAAKTLQFASLNFDVSFQEIFSTWCSGGTLVLVDDDTRRDMPRLLKYLQDNEVERVFLPFVALDHLAQAALNASAEDTQPALPLLRDIITAGEQLKITAPLRRFFAQHPACRLHNHYGPTEAHVVTALRLPDERDQWETLPAIGRPLANVKLFILNKQYRPLPVGVPGELFIGGQALAQGYINCAELTAEKFIDLELFGQQQRLYKTGDLARWREDGAIDYLGRLDDQVKVRGFRIELGEIEAVLKQHPDVKEAAVMVRGELAQLLAYVSFQPDFSAQGENEAALRDFLQQRLPDYMLPARFIILDKLPLNPNGKIDRSALPEPQHLTPSSAQPRDDIELQLLNIWQDVLRNPNLGIHDNFFANGGHSLLAVTLTSHVQQAFERQIPLSVLFDAPTVAELAPMLRQDIAPASGPVAIQPHGEAPPLFFAPGAGSSVLSLFALAQHLGRQRPFFGLQTPGLDGHTPVPDSVEKLAAYHLEHIRQTRAHGPYWLGGHSAGSRVAFEIAQRLESAGETVAGLIVLDSPAPGISVTPESDVPNLSLAKDDAEAYEQAMTYLKQRYLFTAPLKAEGLQALVAVSRQSVKNNLAYHSTARLRCPLYLFRAEQKMPALENDPDHTDDWGWRAFADTVQISWVPGDHMGILSPPHVSHLAKAISAVGHYLG